MIFKKAAQKKLMLLWCISALIAFLFMIVKSIGDMYGSKTDDAWSWFLPTILPTLSLMITVAVIDFTQTPNDDKQSDIFLFRIAFWLSFIYLFLLIFTVLNPMNYDAGPIDLMKKSNLWLGPLQGLVSAALGAFFIKSKNS